MSPRFQTSAKRRRQMVAVSVLAAVGTFVVAFMVSTPASRINLDDDSATAWLPSVRMGVVDRVNALLSLPSVATTDSIGLPMGGGISTARGDTVLAVTDRAPGRAALVDLRTRRQATLPVAAGDELVAVDDRILRVDAAAGTIDRVDVDGVVHPVPLDRPPAPFDRWTVAGRALWLTVASTGALVRVDAAGAARTTDSAFTAGRRPLIAGTATGVALLDEGSLMVGTHRYRADLTAQPRAFRVAPDGSYAVIVTDGTLAVVGLTDGHARASVPIGAAAGEVILLRGRVYLADDTSGAVRMVQVRPTVAAPSSIGVAHGPTTLEMFVKGSAVWANDPNGPDAVAIYDGAGRPMTKYATVSAAPSPSTAPPTNRPPVSPTVHRSTASPTRTRTRSVPRTTEARRATGNPQPPGPVGPSETASFSNIHDGATVGKCEKVNGKVDIAPDETLMIAHLRTSPPDGTYYVYWAGPRDGEKSRTWSTDAYFGSDKDQSYRFYLLIVKVDEAQAFFSAHSAGSYAYANHLPGRIAQAITVHQTIPDC